MERLNQRSSRRPTPVWHNLLLMIGLASGAAALVCVSVYYVLGQTPRPAVGRSTLRLEDIPFNGARAYEHLKALAAIGPRPSGSPGMEKQQRLLEEHFAKVGGQVEFQRFQGRHPQTGAAVPMANVIVRWHPERKQRLLLCAHYDTRPYPDLDPINPRGPFVGANDGASGVAVLMELAAGLPPLSAYGLDMVMFDAEEFVITERDKYFVGSEHFARQYAGQPRDWRYRWAILLDMVGDANLEIPQEQNSLRQARPLVDQVWSIARRLGVREFVARRGEYILDDHIPLHQIGGIPAIVIIDFDYPPWHTVGDTPDKCSPLSLAKVGWVVREWLKATDAAAPRSR